MKHFLDIETLSLSDINELFQRALHFKNHTSYPSYPTSPVVNLFYENSTRTRVSFELAAKHLGMPVVNLDMQRSSESKGEAIEDTLKTLAAMGVRLLVIRHVQDELPKHLADTCGDLVHIINAGDGTHAHPSQAMLDMMTIIENKPCLESLKIAIVGNIRHSRVANSFQSLSAKLKIGELALVAPKAWLPSTVHYGRVTTSLKDGLHQADVVMSLRVQRERLSASEQFDLASYRRHYALTRETMLYAKNDVMVMHPGPVNRGVEIDSDVADGALSAILQQVSNGVFMRMAILERLVLMALPPRPQLQGQL